MVTLSKEKAQELMKLTFQDLTLCLRGIFLVHRVREDLIRVIIKSVDEIYDQAIKSLKELGQDRRNEDQDNDDDVLKPYPAVERLLEKLELKDRKRRS